MFSFCPATNLSNRPVPSPYCDPDCSPGLLLRVGKGFFQRGVCACAFTSDAVYVSAAGCDDKHMIGAVQLHLCVCVCVSVFVDLLCVCQSGFVVASVCATIIQGSTGTVNACSLLLKNELFPILCCAVLCCDVMCYDVLCCAVPRRADLLYVTPTDRTYVIGIWLVRSGQLMASIGGHSGVPPCIKAMTWCEGRGTGPGMEGREGRTSRRHERIQSHNQSADTSFITSDHSGSGSYFLCTAGERLALPPICLATLSHNSSLLLFPDFF
jgi:hypothetical protein